MEFDAGAVESIHAGAQAWSCVYSMCVRVRVRVHVRLFVCVWFCVFVDVDMCVQCLAGSSVFMHEHERWGAGVEYHFQEI